MCLAIPAKIIKINKNKAKVEQISMTKEVNISMLPILKKGDYVIIQGGIAIQKIPVKKMIIEYQPLIFKEKIFLGQSRLGEIDRGFCQEAKIEDWIFSHLDFAATIATEEQMENSKKYFQLTLDALDEIPQGV
jgi:hydrogenase expression/formation protein HypC